MALVVLKIFKLCRNFCRVGKRIDKKDEVNFNIYDVINWETNKYNTYIAQYLKKLRQSENEIWSVNRI